MIDSFFFLNMDYCSGWFDLHMLRFNDSVLRLYR